MKDHHKESEALWWQAETAEREGFPPKAHNLYRQAAEQELLAVEEVDPDRPRWKCMLAVSATALFHRAGDLDKVQQLVERFTKELELTKRQATELESMRDAGKKIRLAITLTKNADRTNEEEGELAELFLHLNRYEVRFVQQHGERKQSC